MSDNRVTITYTNYRGEAAVRTITPHEVFFGSTDWHPEEQWMLRAWDHDKQAFRDFALKDFGHPAPTNPPEKPDSSDLREAVARALWEINCPDATYDEALQEERRDMNADINALDYIRELSDAAIAVVVERCAAQCDDLAKGARKLEAETEHKSMGRERAIAAETLADEMRALARKG